MSVDYAKRIAQAVLVVANAKTRQDRIRALRRLSTLADAWADALQVDPSSAAQVEARLERRDNPSCAD